MMVRFVDGRPVGQVTEEFLAWACGEFAAEGKKVFVLVGDNAAWHVSQRVRAWIARHNRRVAREKKGCRIRVCGLPVKAPWLNPYRAGVDARHAGDRRARTGSSRPTRSGSGWYGDSFEVEPTEALEQGSRLTLH